MNNFPYSFRNIWFFWIKRTLVNEEFSLQYWNYLVKGLKEIKTTLLKEKNFYVIEYEWRKRKKCKILLKKNYLFLHI